MDKLKVYGDCSRRIVAASADLAAIHGFTVVDESAEADVALAPLLERKLTGDELRTPTLVFHPSLLPRHRGRDAIRWMFALAESFGGVTWFWADDGYDTGPVCEQGVVEVIRGEAPRDFYERAVDEGLRLLDLALSDLRRGIVRRRPQRREAQTYEPPWPRGRAGYGVNEHGRPTAGPGSRGSS